MDYELETYRGLPCETAKFIINGVKADKNDFGESERSSDGNYGCEYNIFKPFRYPPPGVLEKYSITLEEFLRMGDALESMLEQHHCDWCS